MVDIFRISQIKWFYGACFMACVACKGISCSHSPASIILLDDSDAERYIQDGESEDDGNNVGSLFQNRR